MKFLKKHYKLILFFLVCLSIFLIYKNNNNNNINYTSLGDGFALGEDSFGQIDYGYSDYVKDYLQEKEQLNRYIKSFSTKTMSIENLYENIVINKKIILNDQEINLKQTLRETSILTLSIGRNDLIYQLSLAEDISNYKIDKIIQEINISFNTLIKEIKKYYPNTIYVIGYYETNTSNKKLSLGIKKLNQLYQKNEDIVFIPVDNLFKNNPDYRSNPNSIYPNQLGYQAIAKEIIRSLESAKEKPRKS